MDAPRTRTLDESTVAFDLEIARSYLASTVREMRQSTARCAYSTCFAEGEDFTCAIMDPRGRLVVQAGLPGHSGTLVDAMRAVLDAHNHFAPGDVLIHNDPFNGGSHQADVMIAKPLFRDLRHVGFAVNKGHWIDVGGASAGGWDGSVTHAVAEGLVIPPAKLYEAGQLRRDLRDFILRNVRMSRYVWGDLQSQIASAVVAERRIDELIDRKGIDGLRQIFEATIEYSRRHFLTHLATAPHGLAQAEDVMEDDAQGGGPYAVRVQLEVRPDEVLVDFTGTAKQAMSPINATLVNARAAAYAAVIAAIDPHAPVSSGCLDLIEVRVPEGCLLNAQPPAPIYAGTADPINRATETVLRAFAELDASRVVAGSYATGNNSVGFGVDERGQEFLWYIFESGGLGARAERDGNSAEWHLLPNCKNESMEIWEQRQPVRFESYRLVVDSAGAGRKRGGLGTERSMRLLCDASVHAVADRHKVPPWGLQHGSPGTCNAIRIVRAGQVLKPTDLGTQSDSKFGNLRLRAGDVYLVRQGGGGGFGPATERSLEEINRDLRLGYVSVQGAERDYDVAVRRDNGVHPEVDVEETIRRRDARVSGQ